MELVLRSRQLWPVFGLGVAVAGNIYVGMPEASFFVIGAAFVYAAVRLVQERTTMPMRVSAVRLCGGGLLGLMLASPLVLLFLEYESLSFNVHKPGLGRGSEADPAWGILHWIVPWFPGAPEPPAGPRNWFGVAVVISALVAVSGRKETKRLHAWLFLVLGVFLLVKIYDFRVLEWVGHLPAAKLVVFPTFAAPVVSFAFAVLAGIGVQVLWNRDLRFRRFLIAPRFGVDRADRGLERRRPPVTRSSKSARRSGVEELSSPFWPSLPSCSPPGSADDGRALLLAGVIVFELFVLAPFDIYAKRADPFVTPGWMALAQSAQGAEPYSRVFAIDGKLYPNTAGALGLQDIRALDALVRRAVLALRADVHPARCVRSLHGG